MRSINWGKLGAEFAVIVVGVLVALAVDDWYAGVQLRSAEITWVTGLRDDLRNDQANLTDHIAAVDKSAEAIHALLASIDDPSREISDPLDYLRKVKLAVITYFFEPTDTTITELTGGGSLSAISNRELVRAVIDYHRAARTTEAINDFLIRVRWFGYNVALAELLEPAVLAAITEDWFRQAGQWPPDGRSSPLEDLAQTVDLTQIRSSPRLRVALARSLDATVVQRGDLYRMLQECESVLAIADAELERMPN